MEGFKPQRPKNQFSRPSVDLGAPNVKREWQVVPATMIEPGDTVPDFGIVETIVHTNDRYKPEVQIVSTMGRKETVPASTECYVFTRVR